MPYKLIKYVPKHGKIVQEEILIKARKIPLTDLCERLLRKQRKYMRLTPTTEINNMTHAQLLDKLKSIGYSDCDETMSHQELCQALSNSECSRSLAMWHYHATILKREVITVTVHTLYDPAVFLLTRSIRI